ncbi:Glycosyltransferase involved in cell wall bisynthesis [Algibacter lectus]|uniref:glycosyltransferase family 2 protein n=1 Tax=Algibacter lectus TaxID=221126 RepID=UPI0008DEEC14|nr:glycosyltransferase family 2 protein [Algibacter lectus]SFC35100.1 Glycosyltransferase involved in cell wall bisynthesis [Algibacter lectus]
MISIIIPTYKRSNRLLNAIDSLLKQTYQDIEIIVVDDNGNNEHRSKTKKTIQSYIEQNLIKYIAHETNQGGCIARNTGAFSATGDYIAFLDDDDFYEPRKLELQLEFLEANKNLDACMCSMFRVDENGKQIISRENSARGINLKDTILDGNLFTSMLLIKTDVFKTLKGFSDIPRFQDKYFHYKFLAQNYKIGVLDQPLLTLVEHTDIRISLTANRKVIDALSILRAFEIKHQSIFNKKEKKYLSHRFYYNKAYNLCEGNINQKINGFFNILKSLPYYTGHFNLFKLTIKTLTPNFILNYKNAKA